MPFLNKCQIINNIIIVVWKLEIGSLETIY